MIKNKKYIILNSIKDTFSTDIALCIFNFDLLKYEVEIRNLIQTHKNTIFWAATDNFSKEYVQFLSKLGIQNVIQFPIKTDVIEKFFSNKTNKSMVKPKNYQPLKNIKVLIVDDNQMNIDLLCEILNDLDIFVEACINPCSAAIKIKNEHYDLFLLDILMPQMSGFDVAELIQKNELNKYSPIVFISAVSGDENIINGYKYGACSYIEKPYSPEVIKAQIYNILKQEQIKKTLQKEQDNFVAMLTHDLKSPINAEITALNHVLKNINENNNEILSEILNSAKYMKLITDKISCFYKQKNSRVELSKSNINFSRLVISCIENIKYLAGEKNIQIYLENNLNKSNIIIDELEISRVINNLIANAIEYSYNNNKIDIQISNNNYNLYFKIRDYGVGIDLDKYKEIFDEYITFSKEYRKIGFGLGLNICKSIIKSHGGDISIKSELNKGTTIEFNIPYDITSGLELPTQA